jgi:hypothetical protein
MAKSIRRHQKGFLIKKYEQQTPYVDLKSLKNVVSGPGLYALYDNYGLYYVGLTETNMHYRIRCHTTDRHKGKWSRFSWYHVPNFRYVKDIETLLLKVVRPPGNRVGGRFSE